MLIIDGTSTTCSTHSITKQKLGYVTHIHSRLQTLKGLISLVIRLRRAHFNPGSVVLLHKYPLDAFEFATLVDFPQLQVELPFRLEDTAEGN